MLLHPPRLPRKTQNLILYVGGGVIIVLLLVVGGIAVVNTRRERKLLAQVQAMAEQAGGAAAPKAPVPDTTPSPLKFTPPSTPAVSEAKPAESAPALGTSPLAQGIPSALGGGSILTDSVISKAVAVEPEEEKPAPEPSAPEIFRTEPAAANIIQESRPAGEADVLILDDLQAASGSPTPAPSAAPSAGLEEIKLPDIDIPMPSEAEAFGIGTPTGEDLATVNLDELLGETKPAEAAPAVAPTMPEAPPVEAKTPASFEVPMPNIVDITPAGKGARYGGFAGKRGFSAYDRGIGRSSPRSFCPDPTASCGGSPSSHFALGESLGRRCRRPSDSLGCV
ncbi:MAG: hypothetical protein KatS3mg130_2021 [Candidatus Sumerlaea sp.]|nr:MAG: hypothetical protein KatS3mg130_2021 [Candidatus Sumerlaea sp.]